MENNKIKYQSETYTLFQGVDESILLLNPYLEKYDYKFIKLTLDVVEKDFSQLFNLPKNYTKEASVNLNQSGVTISNEFYNILFNHSFGGTNMFDKGEMFFLMSLNTIETEVVNNKYNYSKVFDALSKHSQFSGELLFKLRLIKDGDVICPITFNKNIKSHSITSRLTRRVLSKLHLNNYKIEATDLEKYKDIIKTNSLTNDVNKLACEYFSFSYETGSSLKYVNLVTALESIFCNRKSIAFTFAKHIANIKANDKTSYKLHFKKLKKTYKLRSNIVHGSKTKPTEIAESLPYLYDIVRFSILYTSKIKLTKKELFKELSQKRFD